MRDGRRRRSWRPFSGRGRRLSLGSCGLSMGMRERSRGRLKRGRSFASGTSACPGWSILLWATSASRSGVARRSGGDGWATVRTSGRWPAEQRWSRIRHLSRPALPPCSRSQGYTTPCRPTGSCATLSRASMTGRRSVFISGRSMREIGRRAQPGETRAGSQLIPAIGWSIISSTSQAGRVENARPPREEGHRRGLLIPAWGEQCSGPVAISSPIAWNRGDLGAGAWHSPHARS